jgi:hypothetical protein
MKKFFNLFIIAIALLAIITTSMNAFPRKMLVEDHTGAWCGWCPRGIYAIDLLSAELQEDFIPVGFHNGDAMAISLQGTVASAMGITGYPTGIINRTPQMLNGVPTLKIDPSEWADAIFQNPNQTSPVKVEIEYTYNKQTWKLNGKVKATFDQDVQGQLKFNFFIMEDDMTGVGEGWDQHNYLTNRAGYEDNPFYNLPGTVTNYKHQNVLHDMVGGAFGVNGTFPANGVKAGDVYEWTFEYDMQDCPVPVQNPDKLWYVGVVSRSAPNYEILNSVMANKTLPRPIFHSRPLPKFASNYVQIDRGNSITKTVTFTNYSPKDLTVNFSILPNASNYPTDWKMTILNPQAVIKSGETVDVQVKIEAGASKAFAYATIQSEVVGTAEYDGAKETAFVAALSDGFEYAVYYFDAFVNPLVEALNGLPNVAPKTVILPFSSETTEAFSSYPFKLEIFAETGMSRGMLMNNSAILSNMNSMVTKGNPLLITSTIDMFFTAGNYAQYLPDQATKDFYNNTLGITGPKQSAPLSAGNASTGQLSIINVAGTNDDITNGMAFNINQYSSSYPYYTFYLDNIKILKPEIASPILNYNIANLTDNIAAVKVQTPTNRNIYMGFGFDLIADKVTRTTLLGNMITWLLGSTSVDLNTTNSANLSVYPNPVVNSSNFSFTATNDVQNADIYLVDVMGNRIATISSGAINAGTHNLTISNKAIPSGKYFVITNLDGVYSQIPVVIEK